MDKKEYNRLYYLKNREKLINNALKYKSNNPEKIKKYMKKYQRIYRKNNLEKCRRYNKKYLKTYRNNNPEKIKKYVKKYAENNLEKIKAQHKLQDLFKTGNVSNNAFICAICGKQPVEKHHENYDLWYSFIALCKVHHTEIHRGV